MSSGVDFFLSIRRQPIIFALVTGVQTCALPISGANRLCGYFIGHHSARRCSSVRTRADLVSSAHFLCASRYPVRADFAVDADELYHGGHGAHVCGLAAFQHRLPLGGWLRQCLYDVGRGLAPVISGHCLLYLAVADQWPEACRSEEHTSELQSLMRISYAVFCLKKKNK